MTTAKMVMRPTREGAESPASGISANSRSMPGAPYISAPLTTAVPAKNGTRQVRRAATATATIASSQATLPG